MLPYLLILIFIITIGYVAEIGARDSKTRLLGRKPFCERNMLVPLGLLFVVLTLFSGFRGAFTSDHESYLKYFHYIRTLSFQQVLTLNFTMERGFVLLTYCIGKLTSSNIAYMTILSALVNGFFFAGFYKKSAFPCLSVLLFVGFGNYFDSFNTTRQALAVGIAFFSITYAGDKKWGIIHFAIGVLIASMIHRTALILIPFYFLRFIRIDLRSIAICIAVFVVAWLAMPIAMKLLGKYFPQYGVDYGIEKSFGAMIPFIGIACFVIGSIWFSRYNHNTGENRLGVYALIVAMGFSALGLSVALFSRMSAYFDPFICVMIANIIDKIDIGIISKQGRNIDGKMEMINSRWKAVIAGFIALIVIAYVWVWLSGTGYDPYFFSEELF